MPAYDYSFGFARLRNDYCFLGHARIMPPLTLQVV
jgi:hypothetical protein